MDNKELVPLRRVIWVHQDDETHFCSECGHDAEWRLVENDGNQIRFEECCSYYCPHCGSFMEMEDR